MNAESPARVVWVADDGTGDFTLLSAALASITDASATNPYVIRIAPGIYSETSPVALKDYVDVEGSGQNTTTITCDCGSSSEDATAATVSADNINAEIRNFTIENEGTSDFHIGLYTDNISDGSFPISDMTINATFTGTSQDTVAAVYNTSSSSLMLNNVIATANGTGVPANIATQAVSSRSGSNVVLNHVTASANEGQNARAVDVNFGELNNVTATADTSTSEAIAVQITNGTLNNVTATADGLSFSKGLSIGVSAAVSNTTIATNASSGATLNYGVWTSSGSPVLDDVTVTATGGGTAYGVYSRVSSSTVMNNVTVTASGATTSHGVFNDGSGTSVTIRQSFIEGTEHSIRNENNAEASVFASILNQNPTNDGSGTYNCVATRDQDLATITCP